MAIITPKDFRDYYPGLDNTDQDTLLARLIARADRKIAHFCGWPETSTGIYTLESATYIVYPQPNIENDRELEHGLVNVTSITSAFADVNWEYGSTTEISTSDLLNDKERRSVWILPTSTGSWYRSIRANKLTVVAGYTATPDGDGYSTADPALVEAVAMAVRSMWDRSQSDGIVSSNVAGHNVGKDSGDSPHELPRAVKKALAPYVRWESRVG